MTVPHLDQSNTAQAHIASRLQREPLAWLGTTCRDGRPHHVPVWFAWVDPVVVVFSSPATRKVRNLSRSGVCTLTLETADLGQDVVILEGRAELRPLEDESLDPYRTTFAHKYTEMMDAEGFDAWVTNFGQPVVIDIERIVAWSKPAGEFNYQVITA